jgi:hypothetical protein
MAAPRKTVAQADAERRLGGLLRGHRPGRERDQGREVQWPGVPDVKFEMRVLRKTEAQDAIGRAEYRLRAPLDKGGMGIDETSPNFTRELLMEGIAQVLYRATWITADGKQKPLASSVEDFRDEADDDELVFLWSKYCDLRSEVDPNPEDLPLEVRAEIDALVKKKDADGLLVYGSRTLSTYLASMEAPPSTPPTSKSDSGS